MKTAAIAATRYGANAAAAAPQWATGFVAAIPEMLTAAIAATPEWQAAVATARAAAAFKAGLTRAQGKIAAITTKANGAGQASYRAGVTAAAGPGGDYLAFIGPFLTAAAAEVSTLNSSNPRGAKGSPQNVQRMVAWVDWEISQHGNFRVK